MTTKYCPRIYHGLTLNSISDSALSYAVCCWANADVKNETAIDFHHLNFQQLRKQNASNQLPYDYCKTCIEQEKASKQSMRQGYQILHGEPTYEPKIYYLDINIDMTCNLACITCGPELSTTWRKELKIKGSKVRPNLDQFISEQLDLLDLSELKEIRLWGGEPFLTKTHIRLLEYVYNLGIAKQVRIMYNTNGTVRISNDVKEIIEKFKFARISFSIDAIGSKFEYIRYPAKWEQVESNLLWWKNNLPHNSMLSITATVSILNVLDLNELFEWYQKNFSNSVFGDPIEILPHQAFGEFGLEYMSESMKTHLLSMTNYCQPWIQQLESLSSKSSHLGDTLLKLQIMDHRRGLDFSDISPKSADLLGYSKSILATSGM